MRGLTGEFYSGDHSSISREGHTATSCVTLPSDVLKLPELVTTETALRSEPQKTKTFAPLASFEVAVGNVSGIPVCGWHIEALE